MFWDFKSPEFARASHMRLYMWQVAFVKNFSAPSVAAKELCSSWMLSLVLSSTREVCPDCRCPLTQTPARQSRRGAVACQIIAEPASLHGWHVCRLCSFCGSHKKFWCGFVEVLTGRKWVKHIDAPHETFFFLSKKFGVAGSWLRRWRYRMYLHRASFLGEAVLLRLLDPAVQVKARQQLALAWGREILWRRSAAAAPEIRETLAAQLLAKPLEQVLADNWNWYEPMMFTRRLRRVLGYPSNFPQFFHSK